MNLTELEATAHGLRETVRHAVRCKDPHVAFFGEGAQIVPRLAQLEPKARCSVVTLSPRGHSPAPAFNMHLNGRSEARGVSLTMVTSAVGIADNPLLSSTYPGDLRVAPVHHRGLLIDGCLALVEGPVGMTGAETAWLASGGKVLEAFRRLVRATLERSRPALPDGAAPPFSSRQARVAMLLMSGETDGVMARKLGVSQRTVEREVSAILAYLGETSRAAAAAALAGHRHIVLA